MPLKVKLSPPLVKKTLNEFEEARNQTRRHMLTNQFDSMDFYTTLVKWFTYSSAQLDKLNEQIEFEESRDSVHD